MSSTQLATAIEGADVAFLNDETSKRFFAFNSDIPSPKVLYKGFTEDSVYTHNLGYVPFHMVFETDSVTNPTYFTVANTSGDISDVETANPGYLIIFVV